MDYKKDLLLRSAARLYSLGIEVEAARDQLRKLVERGVPYNSPEMRKALEEFQGLDQRNRKELPVLPACGAARGRIRLRCRGYRAGRQNGEGGLFCNPYCIVLSIYHGNLQFL